MKPYQNGIWLLALALLGWAAVAQGQPALSPISTAPSMTTCNAAQRRTIIQPDPNGLIDCAVGAGTASAVVMLNYPPGCYLEIRPITQVRAWSIRGTYQYPVTLTLSIPGAPEMTREYLILPPEQALNYRADLNQDGKVDLLDLNLFAAAWLWRDIR